MSRPASPADIATAVITAFGEQDLDTMARYIHPEITFENPRGTLVGSDAYLEAVDQFAQALSRIEHIAVLGDDHSALIMYDMHTRPFGTLRAADYFEVRDGKITVEKLVFDTYEVRKLTDQPS